MCLFDRLNIYNLSRINFLRELHAHIIPARIFSASNRLNSSRVIIWVSRKRWLICVFSLSNKKRKLFELLSDEHIAFAEQTIKESFADYFEMENSIRRGE